MAKISVMVSWGQYHIVLSGVHTAIEVDAKDQTLTSNFVYGSFFRCGSESHCGKVLHKAITVVSLSYQLFTNGDPVQEEG